MLPLTPMRIFTEERLDEVEHANEEVLAEVREMRLVEERTAEQQLNEDRPPSSRRSSEKGGGSAKKKM